MNNYLFKIPDEGFPDLYGPRGENLFSLAVKGYPIPLTYCLTQTAHDFFVQGNHLDRPLVMILSDKELSFKEKSRKIKTMILSAEIPLSVRGEFDQCALLKGAATKWGIRPSVGIQGFLGLKQDDLFDSFWKVKSLKGILSSVLKCWASLWSEQAIKFFVENNIQFSQLQMAVIIQEMVDVQLSGHLFTYDPKSKNENEIFIEYLEGFNENILCGNLKPYFCMVNKETQKIHYEMAPEKRVLEDEDIHTLCELALRMERDFKFFQHIQWIFDGDHFLILKTKSISTQRTLEEIPLKHVWGRTFINEVLPEIPTPLTWEIFQGSLSKCRDASGQVFPFRLYPRREIGQEEVVKRFFGRAYWRLDYLFNAFCVLPFVSPQIVHHALGFRGPASLEPLGRPRGMKTLWAQSIFILNILGVLPRLTWWSQQAPPISAVTTGRLEDFLLWHSRCFRLYFQVTTYMVGAFAILSKMLGKNLHFEAEKLLHDILCGHENPQTTDLGLKFSQMADDVQSNPVIVQALQNKLQFSEIVKDLNELESGQEFLFKFQEYLRQQGVHSKDPFELSGDRWTEDPKFLLDAFKKYFESNTKSNPPMDWTQHRRKRQEAFARISESIGYNHQWFFECAFESYFQFNTLKEKLKYRLLEGFSVLNKFFMKKGEEFSSQDILDDREDIFFLKPPEIVALMKDKNSIKNIKGLVRQRKQQYRDCPSLSAPEFMAEGETEDNDDLDSALRGISVSSGKAEGLARVVLDASQILTLKPDEILVFRHLNESMIPLFPLCKAIISETGGFLSDTASVLRHYGIPTIFSVPGVTAKIQTGDYLRVHATLGTITIGKREETAYNN